MKKIIFAAAACMAAQFAFGIAASQEWVESKLASVGMRIDTSIVTTNIVSGATNIVITSSFSCADLPGIRQIRLTISPPELSHGDGDVDHDKPYVSCTILDGSISDGTSWFSFADGWTLEQNVTLPDPMPTGVHSCNIGPGCNCTMKDNTRESVLAAIPDDYKDLTAEKGLSKWPSPLSMIDKDTWGSKPWQKKVTVGQTVSYFVTDSPADGSTPHTFNVQAIGASSAWIRCIAEMIIQWNEYLAEMRNLYVDERICTAENPQHDTSVKTCGIYAWATCRRNCGYRSGTEQHQYPGASIDDMYHACVCGHGDPEAHGAHVPDGDRTPVTNTDGKETGWTQTWVCPAGCGHSITKSHTHHFTNCGTCDNGDGCDTVCTGCDGEHVFGDATADECAKCECTMCTGCNAHPPYTETAKHSGWTWCGENDDSDNDDGTANGQHCCCQCLAWGHNAARSGDNASEHSPVSADSVEQIRDVNAATKGTTHHYRIKSTCQRCGYTKKKFELHSFGNSPSTHRNKSNEICLSVYPCTDDCGYEKVEEGTHAPGAVILHENVGPTTCRAISMCQNTGCGAVIHVDTSHVPNPDDTCHCVNGCGRQLDHTWTKTACNNDKCSVCGIYKPGVAVTHSGWYSISGSQHKCACGDETEEHGELVTDLQNRTPIYNSSGKETGWSAEGSCSKCDYTSQSYTHTHHFTNCGTCDNGDGCSTACTGCSGEHVFGDASGGECAKCECTMCTDCAAHPPYTDESKHTGWHPCGEDDEEGNDNADGTANGGHCVCQCLAWSHNAAINNVHNSAHDYVLPSGFSQYEEIKDASATDYAKTHHYKLLGRCSRTGCGRWKKQREQHDWPENPTRYEKKSDSVCRRYYACKKTGCGYEKHDDSGGHSLTGGTIYEAITVGGSPKCRQKRLCANCEQYVNDDTHDHTRGEDCKCANGCGYQFGHSYVQDACGNSKCQYCGAYQYSQESHSGYKSGGTYSAAGHQCACGSKPDVAHVFGAPTVVSQAGWSTILRHTCTACPYYYDEEVNTNPCRNGHVALQSECGCACGYYSPSNNVSTSTEFHKWNSSDVDADGVENCMCKCNTLHTFRSSTYLNNNDRRCPNVCAYCRLRKRDGTYADEDDHEPKASRFERCGCACGRLDSSAKADKFHIPKPGTCTCYGADGNGGTRHFKHPKTGCTRICAYLRNGEEHLVAARDGEEGTTAAYPKDHTKTDSIGLCGCKCRDFDGDEANCPSTFHNQDPNDCGCYCGHSSKDGHHRWPSDDCWCYCMTYCEHKWASGECYCMCATEHRNIQRQDGKCPRVCRGPCNEYLYARDKHSPKDDGCGCECEQFAGADYSNVAYHHGHGSPYCMCACGLHHINSVQRNDCTSICSLCGDGRTNYVNVDPVQKAPSEAHSWTANSCHCKCGKFTDHKYASDSCTCYCGDEQRPHEWYLESDDVVKEEVCQKCGQTISQHYYVYECERCGETVDGYYETGHESGCADETDYDDAGLEPCGCACTDCECLSCKRRYGRCTKCLKSCGNREDDVGGGNSGSTPGVGNGLEDI